MVFSLTYLARAGFMFLRYPSAIPRLVKGPRTAADYIDQLRKVNYSKNPISEKHVLGFDILLNPNDRGVSPSIAIAGWYEPETTELFKRILRKGMTVIDVGANVGWYTLLASKVVGREGLVVSFEPDPTSFSFLKKSVEANGCDNVYLFQECLADMEGTRSLYLSSGNLGGHSIARRVSESAISVEATTLDKRLSEIGIKEVSLVKVDVEGAEPQVILGGKYILQHTAKLLIEYNPEAWIDKAGLLDELLSGYESFQTIKSPFLIKRTTKERIESLHKPTNLYLKRRPEPNAAARLADSD
jgi:FkbM family methyltransferase